SCWTLARPVRDFVQRRPVEGAGPTEETEVRIVYNDHSIYFLFICYDTEAHKIEARLSPRDHIISSDNVDILIDSYFDRRTAFEFSVNAENVQADVLHTDETRRDWTWNSIWFSNVKILDYGWVVEVEIPFTCLRFGNQFSHTWGLNLTRAIERKKEYLQWRMIPASESGFYVSRFGLLRGIEDIRPSRRLEFLPYATAQVQDNEVMPKDFTRQVGLDIKYGLASSTTLDLAINPEFGTVETDEEMLNLSPFPTYYPEKRPFFLEFQDVFRTNIPLVHSRRIGKPLGNAVNPWATILAGARLVGKTSDGWCFGVLEAVADEEKYFFLDRDADGEFEQDEEKAYRSRQDAPPGDRESLAVKYLEPRTNYFIGRVSREFGNRSNFGIITTAVNRAGIGEHFDANPSAYTGGLDWDLAFRDTWQFSGQVAGSFVEEADEERVEGYGTELRLRKFSGEHLTCGVGYDRYSSDFEVNDLGWLYGNDYGTHNLRANLELRGRPQARGVRSWNLNWQVYRTWTDDQLEDLYGKNFGNRFFTEPDGYDGSALLRSEGGSMGGWLSFMNYWSCFFGLGTNFDDVEDPYRAAGDYNFVFVYPRRTYYWFGMGNDYSSPLNVSINHNGGGFRDGSRWSSSIRVRLRPSPNLEFNLEPRLDKRWDFSDFSDPVEVPDTEMPEKILTLRRTRFESLVFRTSYSLSNRLDFRLFAQYTDFHSRRYRTLEEPGFGIDSPDDSRSTLGLHFVTRFEYRPGSYFYLVYRENRHETDEGGGFGKPDRQIIGKFTYWLNKG
ncbi:MAG: carbohydrate binding family 9 domain-containing protein, partial [Candidatus Glassbacteria bacterium]|nr:carbohydrate binding family 9 domain-containing protein [Candidatus Glassbacteria bacterium]